VLKFWRNPEFVRHARAELRPPRAITVALVTLVVCVLVGLLSWANHPEHIREFFRSFHLWLVGMQATILGFWCASGCGQAIARERELKTYDFLKTTRLTAGEIMIGKVTGVPIMAYFIVACSLPVSVAAGALGGFGPRTLIGIYLLLLMFSLFVSLAGLVLSMLLEKSGTAAVSLLILFPMGSFFALADSPFQGLSAVSVLPAVFALYGTDAAALRRAPTLFGMTTSYLLLTPLLVVAFGAWLVLMLVRNLKAEREQIRLLSRWQAVGFGAFLNLLFYAFLNPQKLDAQASYNTITPSDAATLAIVVNGFLLWLIGFVTLTPQEKLKAWWRRRKAGEEGYFSESGLPWPWLIAAAAVAYALLVAEAAGMSSVISFDQWRLKVAVLQLVVLLVFATRDVLFLQWCNVTSMKRPLLKGGLYLALYYIAVSIIAGVAGIGSDARRLFMFQLTTPFTVFSHPTPGLRDSLALALGMGLQLAIILLILRSITGRIRRPASTTASASPT
jgi:hypothetical protein